VPKRTLSVYRRELVSPACGGGNKKIFNAFPHSRIGQIIDEKVRVKNHANPL